MAVAMKHKITSPNDSLQQSTREPSTRLGERPSLGTGTFSGSTRRLLSTGPQIGGTSTMKSYMLDHLSRLYADIEATTRRLELEQRRLCRLDKDLDLAEAEFTQKKQKYTISAHLHEDAVNSQMSRVKFLERQLQKDIADLNEGNAENERLREQIDALRKERKLLDAVFGKLERGIGGSRRAMDRLTSSMNEDVRVGDDAKQKAQALSKMLERERRAFRRDAESLQRAVQREGDVQREQEKLARSSERPVEIHMVADEEEAFSEQAMHRRILKLSFLNTIQRRHIKQHQKNIEVFEQAFATIKSSTGISDIEEIVKIFIALEQRNFSLLTYVNQLNREIESIEIRNRNLEGHLHSHQNQETATASRKESALAELVAQINRTKAATEEKDKAAAESAGALEEARPIIWNIVQFLKEQLPHLVAVAFEGDPPPLRPPPPDEHDDHFGHLLSFIEESVMQFRICLSPDAVAQHRAAVPKAVSSGTKKPSDLPSAHLTGDDSDDDPDTGPVDRPWTRAELRERAQAMIQRRRKKPGQQGKLHEDKKPDMGEDDPTARNGKDSLASARAESSGLESPAGVASRGGGPSIKGSSDTAVKDGDEEGSERKAPFRDEMWWRGQGKEKRR